MTDMSAHICSIKSFFNDSGTAGVHSLPATAVGVNISKFNGKWKSPVAFVTFQPQGITKSAENG
jgi:hypothetical protein